MFNWPLISSFPLAVTVNVWMKCTGTVSPVVESLRKPVSIGCGISTRISVVSPESVARILIGSGMPSFDQAAVYSATLTYLKAVEASGTDDADAVMATLKKTKINDVFTKGGYIRADGRMVHDMYLMQVKKPEDSKYPWDYFQLKKVIPAEEAFQPLSLSKCPMVKK